MEAAFSSFHPRLSPASPPLSSRRTHLPSSAPHCPSLPFCPLRAVPLRRSAAAFWSWTAGGRKRGKQGGGLDRASVERWASIFVLVGTVHRLFAMQPLDALAALLEAAGGAARPGGGVLGALHRRLSGGQAKRRNRAWRRALELAIRVASAAAAAAAFWLLLVGKRLI